MEARHDDPEIEAAETDSEYRGHAFAIDREEAAELFVNVRGPNSVEKPMLEGMRDVCYKKAIDADDVLIHCVSDPQEGGDAGPKSNQDDGEVSAAASKADQHTNGESIKDGDAKDAEAVS
jgi:hypothetical protein